MEYDNLFPFPEPRPQQREAIEFAISAFEKGKRFVILELGTGVGKSGCGVTLGRLFSKKSYPDYKKGAYFLTTQKILQAQYTGDFGPPSGPMCSIKSATNYQCQFFRHHNCAEGLQLLKVAKKGSAFFKTCRNGCIYHAAKETFIKSKESTTNFPYFLTETTYVGKLVPRNLLVIDEAHNIEAELSKFIEVVVSERFANSILKIDMPNLKNITSASEWVRNEYSIGLDALIRSHVRDLEALPDGSEERQKLAAQLERLEGHKSKVVKFLDLYDNDNWVFNLITDSSKSGRKLEFKPIDVGAYSQQYLFGYGKKVLMMSATILNKEAFCESIGINPKDAEFISIPSPFPVENRPVLYLPAGKMSMKEIDRTLPIMAETVKEILDAHPNEKGIIHCRTFKIARFLKENVGSSRFLIHSTQDREEIFEEHMTSDKPTVLVSPSATEGLDLKGDLSRFQIVCKVYWPYMGDSLVKARMDKYTYWYAYQAAKAMIQSLGRSVRDENDHAVSYILDGSFEYFYTRNQELFPEYFKKALDL
jgi:Rad3-related DNA helicase